MDLFGRLLKYHWTIYTFFDRIAPNRFRSERHTTSAQFISVPRLNVSAKKDFKEHAIFQNDYDARRVFVDFFFHATIENLAVKIKLKKNYGICPLVPPLHVLYVIRHVIYHPFIYTLENNTRISSWKFRTFYNLFCNGGSHKNWNIIMNNFLSNAFGIYINTLTNYNEYGGFLYVIRLEIISLR